MESSTTSVRLLLGRVCKREAALTSVWSNFDQDDDGKLSAAEVEADAGLTSSFADMDGDADGFVTQDEYRDYAMVNRKPAEPESP